MRERPRPILVIYLQANQGIDLKGKINHADRIDRMVHKQEFKNVLNELSRNSVIPNSPEIKAMVKIIVENDNEGAVEAGTFGVSVSRNGQEIYDTTFYNDNSN